MSKSDRDHIVKKNGVVQFYIKQQHRLPKSQRDKRTLELALKKSAIYKRWLVELMAK